MRLLEEFKNDIYKVLSDTYFVSSFNHAKDIITVLHDKFGYLVSNDLILHRLEECNIKIDSRKKILFYVSLNDAEELIGCHKIDQYFVSNLLNAVLDGVKHCYKQLISCYRYIIYYDDFYSIDLLFLIDKNKQLFGKIENKKPFGYILINTDISYGKYELITLEESNFKALLSLFEKLND